MLLHCVYLSLKPETEARELAELMSALSSLSDEIDGMGCVDHGPNRDFESKSEDFPYGFVIPFNNAEALARYAENPKHKRVAKGLIASCKGGADGIVVYDLETGAL